jgi:hypothetical protein
VAKDYAARGAFSDLLISPDRAARPDLA